MAGKSRERGQLIKKGEGKYLIRVYLGRFNGKRKYASRTINGTKKEADGELVKWLREMDTQTFVAPKDTPRFHELALQWLESKVDVEPKTHQGYVSNLHLHLLPRLGHFQVNQIGLSQIQVLFTELHEQDYSPSSLRSYRALLAQVFKYARQLGVLTRDPMIGLKLPKLERKEKIETLTKEQTRKLLEANLGYRYGALWALLLGTGLRPQEACALQWDDLEDGYITIRRVLRDWGTRSTFRVAENDAKTKGSLGRLKVPQRVLEILEDHRQQQLKDQLKEGWRSPWIFATKNGKPPLVHSVRLMWKAACKRAGVPVVRLYDTRHTHATQLLEAGVHMKVIQGRLRHSSIQTTMDVYGHLQEEMDTKAADTFDELMENAAGQ